MTTPRKPYGTEDGLALERALLCNLQAAQILYELADQVAPHPKIAGPVIQLSILMGEQGRELMTMQQIRQQAKRAVRKGVPCEQV